MEAGLLWNHAGQCHAQGFSTHAVGACRGMKDVKPEYDCVASVVFSSPQLATVGLSEQEALEKHENIDIFISTFT